jgi:CheY-like chemotaxis protein
MPETKPTPIRVLIVDDEAEIRDSYKQIFAESEASLEMTGFHELRSRLFRKDPMEALRRHAAARGAGFEAVFCDQAQAAVTAVKESLARNQPFAVVFLDMRMPPGQDGVWAATQIRELDPAVEIVICTAYSDTDPGEIGSYVPP